MEAPLPIHAAVTAQAHSDDDADDVDYNNETGVVLPLLSTTNEESNDVVTTTSDDDRDEGGCSSSSSSSSLPPASYWNLLRTYSEYRLFLASFIVTHIGEWLNYVASMSLLEANNNNNNQDGTHYSFRNLQISLLIVVRLLPNVLVSPLGGTLADSYDLRLLMIGLDVMGGCVALSFWLAWTCRSSTLLYVATLCQQCVAGLYDPCRNALVPQMVREANYLQKATTLSGIVWSTMAAVGSSLGGFLVASLGISTCFVLDSLSYMMSAWLLWLMGGVWNAAAIENNNTSKHRHSHHDGQGDSSSSSSSLLSGRTSINRMVGMTVDGMRYILYSCPFGAIILLKFSGALMFGASDVMNAAFAQQREGEEQEQQVDYVDVVIENDDDNNDGHDVPSSTLVSSLQSERLGMLFASVGIGAMLGPLLSDPCVDMDRLVTVQRLCVASFGVVAIGYAGIGLSVASFYVKCLWTIVRASGMAVSWIDSTLLLQKLVPTAMMGRVFAADTALATLGECISATYAGVLLDYGHISPYQLAFLQAFLSFWLLVVWAIYHWKGKGAATIAAVASFGPSKAKAETEDATNNKSSIIELK